MFNRLLIAKENIQKLLLFSNDRGSTISLSLLGTVI